MNNIDNIIAIEGQTPEIKKAPRKRFVRSLEYEVIANLATKQYLQGDAILFDKLLSIPLAERIPGLINNYGLQRAHRLIKMILQEFCYGIALPKSAKLTDTKIAACACDLILSAYEDQLSLEDLIVFFERAKEGKYGKFKGMVTHFSIMQKLEQYRIDRSEAYYKLKDEQEAQLKKMNEFPRIGEVRIIGEIMNGAEIIDMVKRKSG
ncbi:MAG: hypothetical protein EOO10_04820 [Chitinophagaceae bacterium]|nr:MAG: hypothetical protein EOO10_04820 [Chitinophagaceae bacterium]